MRRLRVGNWPAKRYRRLQGPSLAHDHLADPRAFACRASAGAKPTCVDQRDSLLRWARIPEFCSVPNATIEGLPTAPSATTFMAPATQWRVHATGRRPATLRRGEDHAFDT